MRGNLEVVLQKVPDSASEKVGLRRQGWTLGKRKCGVIYRVPQRGTASQQKLLANVNVDVYYNLIIIYTYDTKSN